MRNEFNGSALQDLLSKYRSEQDAFVGRYREIHDGAFANYWDVAENVKLRAEAANLENEECYKNLYKELRGRGKKIAELTRGVKGEHLAFSVLDFELGKTGIRHRLLNNVALEDAGEKCEVDLVVLTEGIVYVCEVKNKKGKRLTVDAKGILHCDKLRYDVPSELARKCHFVQNALEPFRSNHNANLEIVPILVNANLNCTIERNDSEVPVLTPSQAASLIVENARPCSPRSSIDLDSISSALSPSSQSFKCETEGKAAVYEKLSRFEEACSAKKKTPRRLGEFLTVGGIAASIPIALLGITAVLKKSL